jgi:hypothetical protein
MMIDAGDRAPIPIRLKFRRGKTQPATPKSGRLIGSDQFRQSLKMI